MPIAALAGLAPQIGTVIGGASGVISGLRGLFGRRRRRRRAAAAESAMGMTTNPMPVTQDELSLRNPQGFSTTDINRARIRAGQGLTGQPALLPANPAGLLTSGARVGGAIAGGGSRLSNLIRGLGLTTGLGVAGSEAVDAIQDLASGNNNQRLQQPQSRSLQLAPSMGQNIDINALLGMLGAGKSKKATAELLLFSGALGSIIREPVIFESMDGRVRYGSDLGYSLVRRRRQGQEVIFQIPTELGRTLGFVRRRKKPVISVRDSNAIRRAARARDRVYRLAKDADLCVKKGTRRC